MSDLININPNRMELMKLGKRLTLARRGHRLLKDKQDELMDRFTEVIKQTRNLRKDIEEMYSGLKNPYYNIRNDSSTDVFEYYCMNPAVKAEISGSRQRIMNLVVPQLEMKFGEIKNLIGGLNVSAALPGFLEDFRELIKKIVELANAERKMYSIAAELEKVRRRVNALEYIFVPKLEKTIRYVAMQLEEMEREEVVRLMKIKDIVRKK